MPSLKVSELNNASLPLTGNELLPISQIGETVKTTVGNVADLAFGDVAAIYEFNTSLNEVNFAGTLIFQYDVFGTSVVPVQVSNNGKTITAYKGTTPVTLQYVSSIYDLSEDLSLKWTVGGGLYFGSVDFNQPDKSFKILETPKIIQDFWIYGQGSFPISTFNFTTEHAGSIDLNVSGFEPSVIDMSSLKSCADLFRISIGGTAGKTLDVSGLEQWGKFGSSINLSSPFVNIILPTNLKSAANNIDFGACAFTQAAVDAILELFVSLDGTGGKDMWGDDVSIGYYLELSGSNAAPSVAGLANKAILNARLNTTVTTN